MKKMKTKGKRGRKPLGGLRIILRLLPFQVKLLRKIQTKTGISRTELIRRAIDNIYGIPKMKMRNNRA
jgi:hypothetical protein